jgi:hypothetical protein
MAHSRQLTVALLVVLSSACVVAPQRAAAMRQGVTQHGSLRHPGASPAAAAPRAAAGEQQLHSPFNSEASLQIAARQRLFDYAVTQALEILDVAVEKINIPDYKATIEIPVIGGIDAAISNINITSLEVRACWLACVLAVGLSMGNAACAAACAAVAAAVMCCHHPGAAEAELWHLACTTSAPTHVLVRWWCRVPARAAGAARPGQGGD